MPVASRTFSDYSNMLVHAGLIACERARMKGKVRLFKIAAQAERQAGSTSGSRQDNSPAEPEHGQTLTGP